MHNNQYNLQDSNNCFLFGSQFTNFNSVFENQPSSYDPLSYYNSDGTFAIQRSNQSRTSNSAFAARRSLNKTRNFSNEWNDIVEQRDRNYSRMAHRRRRSSSPLAADRSRNRRNMPLGYSSGGASLEDIVDQRFYGHSRGTNWRQPNRRRGRNSPFACNRNRPQQPLVYTSEGAALDAAIDELYLMSLRDASYHLQSSSPFSFDCDLDQPSLPLVCESDDMDVDDIVDQPSLPLVCESDDMVVDDIVDQPSKNDSHDRRGSNGPFASNRIRGQQSLVYTWEGMALDAAIDELERIASRDASYRQQSDSPLANPNCYQPGQPLINNPDGAPLDDIVDESSEKDSCNIDWREAEDGGVLDGLFSASEGNDGDVFVDASEQTSESQSGALPMGFEQASNNQSDSVSSTFSTQQKGKQRDMQSNELRIDVSRSAVQGTLQSDNDQVDDAQEDASFNEQIEPEKLKPSQASVSEVNSLNRQHEAEEKKSTTDMTAHRAQRFGGTNKTEVYQQYKKNRIQERQLAIENGLIPDPNIPVRLEDAIDFRGTCEGMCSEFEMLERQIQNNVDSLEKDDAKNVDPEAMVKAYRRSAAGNEQQLPSDVRTPKALIMTLDHLIDKVLVQYPLDKCHAFIRDRTRSIRQDFTVQNIRDLHAIQVHERIARFHILCLHELCEQEESKFSAQQETEQLRKVLLSLVEFYDDLREEEEIETPNEAEFRAYYYITHMRDQDIARQAQTLPISLFRDPYIQRALQFVSFAQRNNEIPESSSRRNKPENVEACQNFYSKFFDLIADKNTPFLMACLLECNFADVRKGALKAMNVSYMLKAGGVPAEEVRRVLKYDTLAQLLKEAHLYGIIIDMSLGQPTLCFGQKHYKAKTKVFVEPLSNPSQTKSLSLVEPKRQGRSFRDIINNIDSSPSLPNDDFDSPSFNKECNQDSPSFNKECNQDSPYEQNEQQEQKTRISRSAQRDQKQLLEEARAKADAAEARAANERQKLEALIEKKQREAQMKKEKEERLEKENLLKEKLMKEEQERQLQREKEDVLRQERERQEMLLLSQENFRQAAILRSAQRLSKVMDDIIDPLLDEEIRVAIFKRKRARKNMMKGMLPRLAIARGRIAKLNKEALSKQERRQFGQYIATHNPYSTILKQKLLDYRHKHSSSEEIERRVQLSIDFDELVSEDLDELSRSEEEINESVWVKQAFAENIFRRVYDKVVYENKTNTKELKTEWQLFISTPEKSGTTYDWYKRKFDLDDDFCRNVARYKPFDVAMRIVTPETEFGAKWALDVGAVIFDLPNSGLTNEEDRRFYWEECRQRLEDLTQKIQKYSSRKVPILFTYFGDQADTKKTLEQIPKILDLGKNPIVKDYHFLIMNPKTIVVRIVDEVNWLANHSE